MLMYVESSIWQSPAQTLVNAVNTVGVMGKGIALQFKDRYRDMYEKYKAICSSGQFEVGKLWLYKGKERYVLNFPTKKSWRNPSKPEYIELGLRKFLKSYEVFGITSISFPQLGTGNGGLSWEDVVRPLMEKYLRNVPIPVYVHLVAQKASFLPEYLLPVNEAIAFETLLDDIRPLAGSVLHTQKSEYTFLGVDGEDLAFKNCKGSFRVPLVELSFLWGDLNNKKMVNSTNAVGQLQKNYSYIMPLLSRVPYVKTVNVAEDATELRTSPTRALMLATDVADRFVTKKYEMSLL